MVHRQIVHGQDSVYGLQISKPWQRLYLKKKIYEVKLSESHPVVSDSLQPHGL